MKCPYTYPHRSRADKVEYMTSIGGYRDRDGRFPIEFNVGLYYADLRFERLWSVILSDFCSTAADSDDTRLLKEACATAYTNCTDRLFDWAIEAARYTIDPREVELSAKVDLQLRGRSGKHLVITEFENLRLEGCSEEALYEMLMLQDGPYSSDCQSKELKSGYSWSIPSAQVDRLYRYVRECEIDFTPKKASAEVEHQAAWIVYDQGLAELEELKQRLADKQTLAEISRTVYDALDVSDDEAHAAWRSLCVAAGLSPSDIAA